MSRSSGLAMRRPRPFSTWGVFHVPMPEQLMKGPEELSSHGGFQPHVQTLHLTRLPGYADFIAPHDITPGKFLSPRSRTTLNHYLW